MPRSLLPPLLMAAASMGPVHGQSAATDTTDLGQGPHARMHMLFEKTIFKVDVLTLDVWLGPEETTEIDALMSRRDGPRDRVRDVADSIASVAVGARNAWARIEFRRNVRFDRFLDGIRTNLRRAARAGIVTEASYEDILADLPGWYAFLADRGIRSGDGMFYRIRGDTLHTGYRAVDGEVLLDQVDVGPERRLAVMGGYFAPGSDFRDKLVMSIMRAR